MKKKPLPSIIMSLRTLDSSRMRKIMKILTAVVLASAIVGGCSYVNRKLSVSDDHWAEEFLEEHIEDQLGLDVDLTPDSEEN